MSPLLQVAKIAFTHFRPKSINQNFFQGRENSLGQLIYKKSVAVVVLEKSA